MKLLFWVVIIVVAAVLGSFAASNQQTVALGLWPVPVVAELPLYIAMLAALGTGFVVGALAAWLGGGRRRREARRRARRIVELEAELAAARAPPGAPAEPASAIVQRR